MLGQNMWSSHTPYTDGRGIKEPALLKWEVEHAPKYMKPGKIPSPEIITSEMISALEECQMEQATRLLNTFYDTGEIPLDLCKSMSIALPKKTRALKCKHWTTGIMSHVTKLLVRIIMQRLRKNIHGVQLEIRKEQN